MHPYRAPLMRASTKVSERLTVTLGDDQRQRVDASARRRRVSSATVIRWALDEHIGRHSEVASLAQRAAPRKESRGRE